uniref:Predicted gene 867 n=1 Tax=Mus spicilegus TaxID=10103 RepID=A0A8C6MSL5_MUSSI
MFITVMFGAGCRELVNPWCNLVNFTVYLKQKARVPPGGTIALLAEDGHLVKLEEETTQAPSMACCLIQEQVTYVLVQVIKGKDGTPTHYESLLDNLDDQYPELAEELCCLSGFPTTSNGQRRRTGIRRGHREQGPPPSRSRRVTSLSSRNR